LGLPSSGQFFDGTIYSDGVVSFQDSFGVFCPLFGAHFGHRSAHGVGFGLPRVFLEPLIEGLLLVGVSLGKRLGGSFKEQRQGLGVSLAL
jgi:hypothetical protein